MRCSLRPSLARQIGTGGWRARAVGTAFIVLLTAVFTSQLAQAQTPTPTPTATPTPSRLPSPNAVNSNISAEAAVTSLGSNFLERLGNQATSGFDSALRNNPGGGGASEASEGPRFRTWGEGYGISVKTDAQTGFAGDRRQTWGGVAGLGMRVSPGVNIGVSVDQSRTAVDVPLALQSAAIDLTQIGFNASVDNGPWTWAMALVHGFGTINSSRDTGFGIATAGYNGRVDGALTELSYYWGVDQSRLIPKAALEYVRSSTGSFREVGGLDPVAASGAALERLKVLIGAEVGHYWIFDQKIFDLSAYGKVVDNVSQNFSSVIVSLGTQSITVQGVGESRYGVDFGTAASLSLSNTARLYINYDAKLRAAAQLHQGTVGVEFRW